MYILGQVVLITILTLIKFIALLDEILDVFLPVFIDSLGSFLGNGKQNGIIFVILSFFML